MQTVGRATARAGDAWEAGCETKTIYDGHCVNCGLSVVGEAQSDQQGAGAQGSPGTQSAPGAQSAPGTPSAPAASTAAPAQKKTKPNKKNSGKKNSSKPGAGDDTNPATSKNGDPPASLPGKLAGDINNAGKDTSDYVGCYFTRQQLLEYRPKPEVVTLSSADAEALRISVITEALDPQNASAFKPATPVSSNDSPAPGDSDKESAEKKDDPARDFAEEIGNEPFEGLTRSQALSRTLNILRKYTDGKEEPLGTAAGGKVVPAATAGAEKSDFAKTMNYQKFTQDLKEFSFDRETRSQALSDISKVVDKNGGDANTKSNINTAVEQILPQSTASTESQLAKSKVADAARTSLAKTGRPDDIFCSMSILSYETTRKAFGQTMADEYIGVQIVVRNVNPEKEFLVQSAEFKVDDDINGRLARYFSGVDKQTAREYMLASRENGKRNLAVNSAAWLGAVLSATTPFTGSFVKDFSGVFNGGFTTGMLQVFPDHNTEQLKLLDDEGFSNSRTDRTVVPKSGTAEFVIFVSSNQFKQGWWTQDCADRIIIQVPKPDAKAEARCVGTFNEAVPDPKCVKVEIGIDLEAARRVCKDEHKDTVPPPAANDNSSTIDSKSTTADYIDFKPQSTPYRYWSPQALALFRELSLAVVAGTHVNEAKDNQPTLTKISCPVDDDDGNVKLDSAKNGAITCTLTGTNLDQVSQLKLRNSQDATDTVTAVGTVTTSGDSKSAAVSFNVDDLGKLTASAYRVYTVTKDGAEGGGDQLLHFKSSSPLLTDLSPTTIDLTKPATITLTGYHLDKLSSVCLAPSSSVSGGAPIKVTAGTTAQAASLDISGANEEVGTLTLYFGDCNVTPPVSSGKTLSVTTSIAFTPTSAQIGKTLTITGSGLAQVSSVTFSGGVTATPTSATETKVTVVVPAGAITGKLSLNTGGVPIPSADNFTVLPKAGAPAHSRGSPAKRQ